MQYRIYIRNAEGDVRMDRFVEDDEIIEVLPGDEVILVDENGNPAVTEISQKGSDLVVKFPEGENITLADYFSSAGQGDPVEVGLSPSSDTSSIVDSDGAAVYEFNGQVGNLQDGDQFTLMRLSNLGFTSFESLPDSTPTPLGFGGGQNDREPDFEPIQERPAGETSAAPTADPVQVATPNPAPISRQFVNVPAPNRAPVAVDDTVNHQGTAVLSITPKANDVDLDGDPIIITQIDGSPLVVDVPITLTTGGEIIPRSDGTIDYTPPATVDPLDEGEFLTETFEYTISDGRGGTDTATVTLRTEGEDDAMVALPDTGSTTENQPVKVTVLANDSDPDTTDNPLTVVSVTQPGKGIATVDNSVVKYDPGTDLDYLAQGETEDIQFTYQVVNQDGATATQTVTITVTGENDDPTANDDAVTVQEGVARTIDMIGGGNGAVQDTDPDGTDTLSLTLINGNAVTPGTITLPSGALLTINNDGTTSYDPNGRFNGLDVNETATDSFTYGISDGNGGTDTATVTVTIEGSDDALLARPDTATTDQDTPVTISVLTNDEDPDTTDNPLAINRVVQPPAGKGTVTIHGTDVIFNPGDDFDGLAVGETEDVEFTYEVVNQDGATATETVTVTVTGVNDSPTANDDAVTVQEGVARTIDMIGGGNGAVQDTDPDGSDTLSLVQINGNPANPGTITLPSGALLTINGDGTTSYDPNGQYNYLDLGETATDSYTYGISDGNGGTDTATVTVTINGSDDALIARPDTATTNQDTPVTISVLTNDEDPDTTDNPLAINRVLQPPAGKGSVTFGGTSVIFNPGDDFDNLAQGETEDVQFTYEVINQDGSTAMETVTVTVTGINDAPTANDDAVTVQEGVARTIDMIGGGNGAVQDTDPDGSDTLSLVEINGNPANPGTITLPSGALLTINGDGTTSYNPNGQYNYLDAGETATDSYTYGISDGHGGTDTATVTVTITGSDDAMTAQPDTAATDQNTATSISVLANDNDPDTTDNPLVVDSVSQPPAGKGNVSINGTNVVFNPGDDFDGLGVGETEDVQFTYDVVNQDGARLTETVTVTVTGTNDGPTANDDAASVGENGDVNIDVIGGAGAAVADTDPDTNDTLVVTHVNGSPIGAGITLASGATVTLNGDGTLNYDTNGVFNKLDAGENGSDSFTYSISDGNGGTDTATVNVDITGSDDALIAQADTGATDQDTSVVVSVLNNDSDPDTSDNPLSVNSVGSPPAGKGTTTHNGTTVEFNPGNDFDNLAQGETEDVQFTYEVINQDGATATQTVTITVTGTNDGPTANDDAVTVQEGVARTIDMIGGGNGAVQDTDPDGTDTLSLVQINGNPANPGTITLPSGARLTINGDGTTSYDPNGQFNSLDLGETATDSFTYSISDGNGGSDTATVNVTIAGSDDALIANPDTATTAQRTPVTISVLNNDSDPDTSDNPLAIHGITQPPAGKGSVVIGGTDVVFNPGNDFDSLGVGDSENVQFTYEVINQDGARSTQTVTVTVTGSNLAPTANDDAVSVGEDSTVSIDMIGGGGGAVQDTDPNASDTLSLAQINGSSVTPGTITLPSGARLTINGDGTTSYDPNGQFNGLDINETATDSFTYGISDGNGGTDTATVTVTINGRDDALIARPDAATTSQDTPVTIGVLNNDEDPDTTDNPLAINGVNQPPAGKGSVSISGTNVIFNPGNDFDGLDAGESEDVEFTYEVINQDGSTATETVTVTVNGTDDALTAQPDTASTSPGVPVIISVLNNDDDPDTTDNPLAINGVTQPPAGKGSVSINGTNVVFNPGNDFDGLSAGQSEDVQFTYEVINQDGDTETETVTVTVGGANVAPTANDDAVSVGEDGTVNIDMIDGGGGAVADTDPNLADTLSLVQINGNSVTPGTITLPSGARLTVNGDGTTSYDPNGQYNYLDLGQTATDSYTYGISDGNGGTDTATVTVTITGADDALVAQADTATTDQDTPATINVLANDSDPDTADNPLIVSAVDQPAGGGSTSISGNQVVFDPGSDFDDLNAGQSRQVTFDYTVRNQDGETEIATVTVTVNGANDPVDAVDDSASTNENALVTIDVLSNDIELDTNEQPLTIDSFGQPPAGKGTVTQVGQQLVFNPGSDFLTLDAGETEDVQFTYTARNGAGQTETATVTVQVIGLNEAPTANDDAASTTERGSVVMDLVDGDAGGSVADTDPNGDSLTIATIDGQNATGTVTISSGATVTINGDGTVTYNTNGQFTNLNNGVSTTDSFDYTISDGNGGTSTATATVTITGDNNPPVAGDDLDIVTVIGPVTYNVLGNDTDLDGSIDRTSVDLDPNTAGRQTSRTVTGEGTWTVNNDGDVTFTPVSGISTQPTEITYTVDDNLGQTSNAAKIKVHFATADIWFGNDESGSVSNGEFRDSRDFISGTANLVSFGTTVGVQAAVYSWGESSQQNLAVSLTDDKADFVSDSAGYSRSYDNGTDIAEAINYGVATAQNPTNGARAGVPQVLVILTDAFAQSQILDERTSIQTAANSATNAGFVLIFVAIDDAIDPTDNGAQAVAFLESIASQDLNGDPLVLTADSYDDIDTGDMADLIESIAVGAYVASVPPVVIDLDGDGVEFTSLDEGIDFDADGDGVDERTAWAGQDDAVLVFDADGDQTVSGRSEVAFSDYSVDAETDLEGLQTFDTDADGTLDAGDERFDQFALWQDKDGDGEVGEGEWLSLTDAGIESIGLTSDGQPYVTADGDVQVHGTSEVIFTDGTVTDAADAEFNFVELPETEITDGLVEPEGMDAAIEVVTESGESVNLSEQSTTETGNSGSQAPVAASYGAEPASESTDATDASAPVMDPLDEAALAAASAGM